MEENEVYVEEITEQDIDCVDLVDSVPELEEGVEISQEQLISALENLILNSLPEEEVVEEQEEVPDELIDELAVNDVDYSDILDSIYDEVNGINVHLSNFETLLTPHNLFTPINDYTLTEFFIFIGLVVAVMSVLIRFITDNVFHIRR